MLGEDLSLVAARYDRIVLDLGAGGGKIAFIAAQVVGREGRVIGVNFDRAYEATINDYAWSQDYSRSIGVDIRYDRVASAIAGVSFKAIEDDLKRLWEEATHVAAMAFVVAKKRSRVNPDEAMVTVPGLEFLGASRLSTVQFCANDIGVDNWRDLQTDAEFEGMEVCLKEMT